MMTLVTMLWCSSQAIAIWATDTPFVFAMFRITSTHAYARSMA
jgi:hypothetical protein